MPISGSISCQTESEYARRSLSEPISIQTASESVACSIIIISDDGMYIQTESEYVVF